MGNILLSFDCYCHYYYALVCYCATYQCYRIVHAYFSYHILNCNNTGKNTEKRKYIQTLIEAYRVMHQEEKKRLAREGLYYRVLPILGLTAFYILLVFLAWLHII